MFTDHKILKEFVHVLLCFTVLTHLGLPFASIEAYSNHLSDLSMRGTVAFNRSIMNFEEY